MADQNTTVPRGGQAGIETQVAQERRRELAIEHLLFNTIRYVQRQHPGLLDELERSLAHLGDSAHNETKDDEAVREIARRFIKSLRAEG
jgi:hypothetical protein